MPVGTKVLEDSVGRFCSCSCSCSLSGSKRTESETSLAAIQHFVSDGSPIHFALRFAIAMRLCTQRSHAHNSIKFS